MENGMVERVARALCVAAFNRGEGNNSGWVDFTDDARAAIEAMREPTEDQVAAGIAQMGVCTDGGTASAACIPEHVWPAMIDAALGNTA